MSDDDPLDPQGLMREAFRIEGITLAECRGLFFDWALSLPDGTDTAAAIRSILARHAPPPEAPLQQASPPQAEPPQAGSQQAEPQQAGPPQGQPRSPRPQPAPAPQSLSQHPMARVLTDGLQGYQGRVSRRGGWRGRRAGTGRQ